MALSKSARLIIYICLSIIIVLVSVAGTSCKGNTANGVIATTLGATQVPDLNLDLYLYFNQDSPTAIPKNWLQTQQDIQVESVAVWGIVENDTYSIAGAINFTDTADAATINSLLMSRSDLWVKLVDKTIYLVNGSGNPADSFKNAITDNKFKQYDDQNALSDVSRMPYSASARPLAVGIIKPSQAALDL